MTDDLLWSAIKAARERWSPNTVERCPPISRWAPLDEPVGTDKPLIEQDVTGAVPTVPTVPTAKHEIPQRTAAEAAADVHAEWEERAAIIEFEGGLGRSEAERLAAEALGDLDDTAIDPRR